jgi:hypothetical protein
MGRMTTDGAPAVEALKAAWLQRDFARVSDRLAEDVVFRSPVLEAPWSTKAVLDRLGPAMVSIFDDVAFTDTAVAGRRTFLLFTARRDATPVEGVQIVDVDAGGLVTGLTILIRPLPALVAVARAMRSAVDPGVLAGHGR